MGTTLIITYSEAIELIRRHLSYIGKRAADGEERKLFSSITTSTLEDPILEQYIDSAVENILELLSPIVTNYAKSANGHEITLTNDRWSGYHTNIVRQSIISYYISFVVGEYLSIAHHTFAEKYHADTIEKANVLLRLALWKDAPLESTPYNTIKGEVVTS